MGKEQNTSLGLLLRTLPHTGRKPRFGTISCSGLTGGRLISVIRTIFNAKLKRYYKDETVGNKRSLANFFIYMGHVNLSL